VRDSFHTSPALIVVARHAESMRNVAKAGQVFFPIPRLAAASRARLITMPV
jgi:hypothetical protein